MLQYIKSENIKFKRGISRTLIFIVPIFLMVFNYFVCCSQSDLQKFFNMSVVNVWGLVFCSLGIAIYSCLSNAKDRNSGGYKALISKGADRFKLWCSKIFIIGTYMCMSSIFMFLLFMAWNYIFFGSCNFSFNVVLYVLYCCITVICLTPISLFISYRFSDAINFIIGFIIMCTSAVVATKDYWFIDPWCYPLRAACPLMGIHPNGTVLPAGNALWNASVIWYMPFILVVVFFISLFLTYKYFNNSEVK